MSNNKNNEFYTVLCRLRDVSSTINALDSVFVLAPALFFYLAGNSLNFYYLGFAGLCTAFVCGCYLYVVEYGQNKLGSPTFEGIFGKYSQHVTDTTDKKNVKYLYRAMLFLIIVLGVASVGTSVYLRDSTAHIITEKPNITNVDSLKSKTDKSISDISNPIEKQIIELKKEKDNVKSNVLAGQSVQMRDLYNNGHQWAHEQVDPIIKSRKAKLERQIQAKEDVLNNSITSQQSINAATLSGAITANNFNIQSFETMRAGLSTFTLLVSVFSYFIFLLTSFIIGFYRAANLGGESDSKKLFSFASPTLSPSVNGANIAPNMATVNHPYNDRQIKALIENGIYNGANIPNVITNNTNTPPNSDTTITPVTTVITAKKPVKSGKMTKNPFERFEAGEVVRDADIREMITLLQADINNYKTGNGNKERILERLYERIDLFNAALKGEYISIPQCEKGTKYLNETCLYYFNLHKTNRG